MFAVTVNPKVKSKKVKIIIISVLCVLVLFLAFVCVSAFVHTPPKSVEIPNHGEYSTIAKTDEDVMAFAQSLSYEVEELYSLQEIYVPIEFDEVYNDYNELQKSQGFDLSSYKGEKCKLYIYKLKDEEIDRAQAYMSVIVLKDRVIGGHISNMTQDCESYTFFGE